MDTASNIMVTNSTMRQVIRTGVDGTAPSLRGIFETSASPLSGGLWILGVENKWQSTSPNFLKSDELDDAVDGNLSNNPIV